MKYRSTRSLSGSSDLYSFEEVLFSPGLDPFLDFKKFHYDDFSFL
jgi:hypothetical protein